jgi:hypothetical protein
MDEEKAVKELRKQILKEFFKFLKEKKVYTKYRKNIADCVVRERYKYVTKEEKRRHWYDAYHNGVYVRVLHNGIYKMDYERCRELINYAFCWSDTPEKHNFWSALNSEWGDIFSKNYRPYASVLDERK